jgi:hypothetical protein
MIATQQRITHPHTPYSIDGEADFGTIIERIIVKLGSATGSFSKTCRQQLQKDKRNTSLPALRDGLRSDFFHLNFFKSQRWSGRRK